jgi:hypothetical protein
MMWMNTESHSHIETIADLRRLTGAFLMMRGGVGLVSQAGWTSNPTGIPAGRKGGESPP